jgi:hypothetical protein
MPLPYSLSGTAVSLSSVGFQKLFGIDVGLPQDRPEGALRKIPRVIGNSRVPACLPVEPDFVAAGSLTMELKAKPLQSPDHLAIVKAGQPTHYASTMSG